MNIRKVVTNAQGKVVELNNNQLNSLIAYAKEISFERRLKKIIKRYSKITCIYSGDEGHPVVDDNPGELIPIQKIELPF